MVIVAKTTCLMVALTFTEYCTYYNGSSFIPIIVSKQILGCAAFNLDKLLNVIYFVIIYRCKYVIFSL